MDPTTISNVLDTSDKASVIGILILGLFWLAKEKIAITKELKLEKAGRINDLKLNSEFNLNLLKEIFVNSSSNTREVKEALSSLEKTIEKRFRDLNEKL